MHVPIYILAATLLLGCSRANESTDVPQNSADTPMVNNIANGYKKLTLMTKKPVYVDPILAMLCRGASQAQVEAARKVSGPHAHTAINIYMNELAANTFRRSTKPFPVGSVKEKRALHYWPTADEQNMIIAHNGVGGMIKRAAGYDPGHGDWEYFYFEEPTRIESGKMSSCVQCHSGAATNDYVFGGWATPSPPLAAISEH
jgi:hypothetical protein